MKLVWLVIPLVLANIIGIQEIFAESNLGMCGTPSLEERFNRSDAVFYGIPITKETVENGVTQIQINVFEVYKGNITKGINMIQTREAVHFIEGTLYGDPFHELEKGYVVYATNQNGYLFTSSDLCWPFISIRSDMSVRLDHLPDSFLTLTSSELPVELSDETKSQLWWIGNFWNVVFLIGSILASGIIIVIIKNRMRKDSK